MTLVVSIVGAAALVAIAVVFMVRRERPARDRDLHRGDWPPDGMAR